jgi:hypothetical protein
LQIQEECEIFKVNVHCSVQGDIVIECISMDEEFEHEVMVFRAMFSTAFVEDNLLVLDRDQIDILWDTKHRFPVDFRVEVVEYPYTYSINCLHNFTFKYSYPIFFLIIVGYIF